MSQFLPYICGEIGQLGRVFTQLGGVLMQIL
jgi:hypothetical protein